MSSYADFLASKRHHHHRTPAPPTGPALVCHLFGHDPRPPTMTCRDCGTNLTGET